MRLTALSLHPRFRPGHSRVLLRYLADERSLAHGDWATLAEGIEALGCSTMVVDGVEVSFRRFYGERVDSALADRFLSDVLALHEPEREGPRIQASTAREICALLDGATGFSREDAP